MIYASGSWELLLAIMVLVSQVAGLAFLVVICVAAMIPFRGRSISPDGAKRKPGGAARLFWLRVLSAVVLSLLLWSLMALRRTVLWPIAPGKITAHTRPCAVRHAADVLSRILRGRHGS